MKIYIQCKYTLLLNNDENSTSGNSYTFQKTLPSGRTIEMIVSYSKGSINARMEDIELEEEVITELKNFGRFEGANLSKESRAAIDSPLNEIRNSVRNLTALLKYHLRHFHLNEGTYSAQSEQWATDIDELQDIPSTLYIVSDNFSSTPLDDRTYGEIQAALTSIHYP